MGTGGATSYSYKKRHLLLGVVDYEHESESERDFLEASAMVNKFLNWAKGRDIELETLNKYTIYQYYLEYKGYGEATVLSDDEFLQYMTENEDAKLLSRGMPDSANLSGAEKLEQPMYSEKYYTGNGIHGDGLYFARNNDHVAPQYAIGRLGSGAIALATLKKNARVISESDLMESIGQTEKTSAAFNSLVNKAGSVGALYASGSQDGVMSVLAREMGYDAIIGGHTVVLNRSAVIYNSKVREFTSFSSAQNAIREYDWAITGSRDGIPSEEWAHYRW